jgi:hypothetical protein
VAVRSQGNIACPRVFQKERPCRFFEAWRCFGAKRVCFNPWARSLLNSTTAVVMRKGYETFVIQDASAIDNRKNVLALVHVKDMECYDRLTIIQTNHLLHRGTLDPTISNDLADEMTRQLLKEAGKLAAGNAGR